ncbi:hypothetical protein BC826DRAFT_955573 [Russula brevipes]|nr:hypothetical protein BC826DRAFT_955573 [Russula brevipes]
MQQTANDVDQVKRTSSPNLVHTRYAGSIFIGTQSRQDLHRWLSPSDPSTNHNIACGSHHEGTAEWFFQGSIFKGWKSTGSLLWLHGKPGSGKTIICSAIIHDILSLCDTGMASIGYFYFDFRDKGKQTRANLLPSLVTQLSAGSDPCCDILSRFYCAHKNGTQKPSEAALMECLKEMVTLPNQPPIYLIVDALDECPNTSGLPSPREQVLELLQELVDLSLPNLHICVTSRPEIDIRAALEPLTSRRVSLHDQSGQKNDIIEYVTSVVHSDARMRRWREEDRKMVIETLSERADGMFRWVFCQLEALRYCFPPSVRHMLEELPETLDETYERVLREIHKTKRGLAHRLLQCLTVAIRPLRVAELAEVLAVDFGMATSGGASKLNTDWRWEDQQHAILSTCSSLIAVVDDDGSEVVQFAHFSVKEFLASSRLAVSSADVSRFHIPLEPAHTILAKACLGVLLRLDDRADGDTVETSFPLARYAAEHWADHAQFGKVSSYIREGMEDIFNPDKPLFSTWLRVYDIDLDLFSSPLYWFSLPSKGTAAPPLYYAALCGFHDLAEHLIVSHGQDVNAVGGHFVSPLAAALAKEHFDIAQMLYQRGADVDVQGFQKRTPLYGASKSGHLEIGRWLLNRGANPNFWDSSENWTPLHVAASSESLEVIRLLLHHKADKNARSQDQHGEIPLHIASGYGRADISRCFLEHGVDVNVLDHRHRTPLHLASRDRHLEVARLLIENGANLDAKDSEGRTALQVAKGKECKELLLEHGAKDAS